MRSQHLMVSSNQIARFGGCWPLVTWRLEIWVKVMVFYLAEGVGLRNDSQVIYTHLPDYLFSFMGKLGKHLQWMRKHAKTIFLFLIIVMGKCKMSSKNDGTFLTIIQNYGFLKLTSLNIVLFKFDTS